MIYRVDSAIQRLNNRGQINIGETNPVDIEMSMYMYPVYSAHYPPFRQLGPGINLPVKQTLRAGERGDTRIRGTSLFILYFPEMK